MNLVPQGPTCLVRGQASVLHLQRRQDALGDDITPRPGLKALHDLPQQREREVGVVEGEVHGQDLLGILELAQQTLLVGGVEALPDPADRLTLQAGGVGQHLPDGDGAMPGLWQVRVEPIVQREPAGVAQRHDQHRSERLGDQTDHVLRVIGRRRQRIQPGATNVAMTIRERRRARCQR